MPSSTSSSELCEPPRGSARTWLLAGCIVVATLLGCELLWRSQGFGPSVSDDEAAWAVERSRLRSDSVALLGSSRMQADVDPAVWAEAWGGSLPIQLSIAGASPLPVLEALAFQTRFAGLALVDTVPGIVFGSEESLENDARARNAAYTAVSSSPARMIEARLRMALQGRFVALRMSPFEFASRSFLRTDPGRILYFTVTPRRFLRLDFELANLERRIDVTLSELQDRGEPPSETDTARIIDRFAAAIAAIRARGGEVVLVHMPHSGAVRTTETESYPRDRYWDRLVAASGARGIHVEDHEALADFDCPDGSHLDVRDTPRFTQSLARTLRDERDPT